MGAVLVERNMRQDFDRLGRCWQRVVICRIISPAEFDARCDTAVSLAKAVGSGGSGGNEGGRRPAPSLQWALGDHRCGAQLLVDAAADLRLTLVRLRGSRRGRALLDRLAVEVLLRFGPRMRAAREAVDGDAALAAWARRMVARPWPPAEAAAHLADGDGAAQAYDAGSCSVSGGIFDGGEEGVEEESWASLLCCGK